MGNAHWIRDGWIAECPWVSEVAFHDLAEILKRLLVFVPSEKRI